jgi:hypothetical protein
MLTARQPPTLAGRAAGTEADDPDTLEVTTPVVDQPHAVQVRAARRASERLLPRAPRERATRRPAREIERRLSPVPTPARMMNILEAEGGTKIAARLAFPHHQAGGHHPG